MFGQVTTHEFIKNINGIEQEVQEVAVSPMQDLQVEWQGLQSLFKS